MNNLKDPYEVLGVPRNASMETITSEYRKLAKRYHPDLNPGDEIAAKKMAEINAAYDSIKNGTADSFRQSEAYRNAADGYAQQSQGSAGSNPYGQTSYSGYSAGNTYYYRSYGPSGSYYQEYYRSEGRRRRTPLGRFLIFYIVLRIVLGLLGLLTNGIFSPGTRRNTQAQPQNPYNYEQEYRSREKWNL